MARSRLEKIGTIFERVEGLLKSGAIKSEDKPIWFDVYKAFPPKLEPRFDRPAPNVAIRPIFYKEDVIRAKFQRNNKSLGMINLHTGTPTVTQQFLATYQRISEENKNLSEDELYETTLNIFNNERLAKRQQVAEKDFSTTLTEKVTTLNHDSTQLSDQTKTAIKDIFKE